MASSTPSMRLTIDVDLRVVRALQAAALGQGAPAATMAASLDSPREQAPARRAPRRDGCGVVVDIKV